MKIINEPLLAEFRRPGRCEFCGRPCPDGRDPHHYWQKRGMGGGSRIDHPWNLISLCRGFVNGQWVSCHQDAEAGKITKYDLLAIVAKREGVLQGTIRAFIKKVKYADKRSCPGDLQAGADHRRGDQERAGRNALRAAFPGLASGDRLPSLDANEGRWGIL